MSMTVLLDFLAVFLAFLVCGLLDTFLLVSWFDTADVKNKNNEN
jgi:hypothetical protein